MHSYKTLLVDCQNQILHVTLNRPEVKNAINDELINDLTHLFQKEIPSLKPRMIVLSGTGDSFCAGADLRMLEKKGDNRDVIPAKAGISLTPRVNQRDSRFRGNDRRGFDMNSTAFSSLLVLINKLPCPLVGKIHGSVMGGGIGLVAVCDIVVASKETLFAFPEAKLGLIPAIIAPYVLAKIGESHTRSLFLSAERFTAQKALEIALVHKMAQNGEEMVAIIDGVIKNILEASPNALATAKKYLADLKGLPHSDQNSLALKVLDDLRDSEEGKEGVRSFLEKRKPNWIE